MVKRDVFQWLSAQVAVLEIVLDLILVKSFLKKEGLAERFHDRNNEAKSVVNEHCTATYHCLI